MLDQSPIEATLYCHDWCRSPSRGLGLGSDQILRTPDSLGERP